MQDRSAIGYTPAKQFKETVSERRSGIHFEPIDHPLDPAPTSADINRRHGKVERIFFTKRYSLEKLEEMGFSEKLIYQYMSDLVKKYPGLKVHHLSDFLMCSSTNDHFKTILKAINFKSTKGITLEARASWRKLTEDYGFADEYKETSKANHVATSKPAAPSTVKEVEELVESHVLSDEEGLALIDEIESKERAAIAVISNEKPKATVTNITLTCDAKEILNIMKSLGISGMCEITIKKL